MWEEGQRWEFPRSQVHYLNSVLMLIGVNTNNVEEVLEFPGDGLECLFLLGNTLTALACLLHKLFKIRFMRVPLPSQYTVPTYS